ncbi:ribonuclease J [Agrobacterium rhizogenes]|uniref:Metallo-beta-lactamase family protein n=1 Tax=Rhizobium rhizogenes (strain K84 / ATCC BAA-868) TaxID=311403 RepID=B9JD59_RHIR8|nr:MULTISPECIES: ribonuclease J [Rhizobium]ACM26196.1 metallo-beta-lactamase family protein [Rhizobium rhizogenes K84]OCJ25283.1 MBL fold metallo-hydrolase [Agrobacterium sp. B131/95]OCJ31561.1 MBL fold metallo-hydrolase [Agrobacterium sp. B133/95]EJK87723.1 putative hydrolase of the metallo-beta-lactamase superfamily [Rhizobium sp. AP16]MDJ1632590.1 ribonuclease J [Rhizobium rhizogenes]
MAKQDELVFLPLGGVGEIGMNLALYGYGTPEHRQWIMVDCGVTFPGPDLPGVDLVLPDIRFLAKERKNLKGIIITHAHEDHYGALSDLWPGLNVPVYASGFTAGLLEAKRDYEKTMGQIPITPFKAGDRINVGPFSIEGVAVNHSIPEPMSLMIRTPVGNVIHTGDWKIDHEPSLGPLTDEARFRQLGDEGVLALMCDSTNALRDGVSPSEKDVSASLRKIIENAEGRVAITTFSSNVGRIRTIAEAAEAAGREILLLGSSLKRVVDVSRDIGIMEGLKPFIAEDEYGYIPRDKVVIILTGSQGEPRAALAKLSRDEMRHVALAAGDIVVFSSRAIPGNEKAIQDIKNGLTEQGVHVVTDAEALVHVSGHPRRNELQKMYEWTRPKVVVPVHGEPTHLAAHKELAEQSGIAIVPKVRNGDILRLAPGSVEVIGQAPHGRIFKDGILIGDFDEMGIGERKKLSYVGHVAVNVVLDARYDIVGDPDIVAIGLPAYDDEGEEMEDTLFDAVVSAIESIPRARRKDIDMLQEAARRAVRAAANHGWGKKPVVTVFVTRMAG